LCPVLCVFWKTWEENPEFTRRVDEYVDGQNGEEWGDGDSSGSMGINLWFFTLEFTQGGRRQTHSVDPSEGAIDKCDQQIAGANTQAEMWFRACAQGIQECTPDTNFVDSRQ
jgi:hypothetical protein